MFRRPDKRSSEPVTPPSPPPSILDSYVRDAPSPQGTIDLFAGEWSSRFPDRYGLTAGPAPLFEDPRVTWTVDQIGGVDGFQVLELGPLEGGHTAMLEWAGAEVTAVESNTRAFLKCLVVKELLNLRSTRFLLGDFVHFMESANQRFDLVMASGVLYHAPSPLRLLEAIAGLSDRVAIWTHYFDPAVVAANPHQQRMFAPEPTVVEWHGTKMRLHRRNYLESLDWSGFCGGPETSAMWMERDGILEALTTLGFGKISIQSDDLGNPNGACVMLLAQR